MQFWQAAFIPREDGLNIRVIQSVPDTGKGPTCLLIHGFGDGGYVWRDRPSSLSDMSRLVIVDLRGHGDSDWSSSRDYSLAAYVADVESVIEALCLERIVLIGHSLGGKIAIHTAATYQKQVIGMVLADFGPDINPIARHQTQAQLRKTLRSYRTIEEFQNALLDARPLLSREVADHLAREALRSSADGYRLKLDPALAETDEDDDEDKRESNRLWRLLAQCQCPVLIARGAGSAFLSSQVASRMHRTLRNARLKVVPKAGHAVMIDNPAYFYEIACEFVREVEGCSTR